MFSRHRSYGYSDYDTYGPGFGSRYTVGQCCGCIVLLLIVVGIVAFFIIRNRKQEQNQHGDQPQIEMQQPENHEDIYVPALERSVSWNTEYDCYYDQPTDCYFFKNTDVEPPIWQYWFETISADYGDFGWMEWDEKEQKWYIETGESKWEKLPEDKYSNYLWHFD